MKILRQEEVNLFIFIYLPSLIVTLHCYYFGIHFALEQSFSVFFVFLFLKAELIFIVLY